MLGYLLLGIIVGGLSMVAAMNIVESGFDSPAEIYATDISYLLTTISASSFDLTYAYEVDLEDFIVTLQQGKVSVEGEKGSARKTFSLPEGVTLEPYSMKHEPSLVVTKKNNVLSFGSGTFSENCQEYQGNIKGVEFTKKSFAREQYPQAMKNNLNDLILQINPDNEDVSAEDKEVVQIIHGDSEEVVIKHSGKIGGASRLACFISNRLIAKMEIEESLKENEMIIALPTYEYVHYRIQQEENYIFDLQKEIFAAVKEAVK